MNTKNRRIGFLPLLLVVSCVTSLGFVAATTITGGRAFLGGTLLDIHPWTNDVLSMVMAPGATEEAPVIDVRLTSDVTALMRIQAASPADAAGVDLAKDKRYRIRLVEVEETPRGKIFEVSESGEHELADLVLPWATAGQTHPERPYVLMGAVQKDEEREWVHVDVCFGEDQLMRFWVVGRKPQ